MTADELRTNYKDFYDFLLNYTKPPYHYYFYDINGEFTKPYTYDIINDLLKDVNSLIPDIITNPHYYSNFIVVHNEFKILSRFKGFNRNFYDYLKIKLRLEDSTIARYLIRAGFTTRSTNNHMRISVEATEHYREYYEDYGNYLNLFRQPNTTTYHDYLVSTSSTYDSERIRILRDSETRIRDMHEGYLSGIDTETDSESGDVVGFYRKSKKVETHKKSLNEKEKEKERKLKEKEKARKLKEKEKEKAKKLKEKEKLRNKKI